MINKRYFNNYEESHSVNKRSWHFSSATGYDPSSIKEVLEVMDEGWFFQDESVNLFYKGIQDKFMLVNKRWSALNKGTPYDFDNYIETLLGGING
jgi:hypothetical protein